MAFVGPHTHPDRHSVAPAGVTSHPAVPRRRQHGNPRPFRASTILAAAAALLAASFLAIEIFSPWPPILTVRHLMAAPSCERAAKVGLAPALRGQPGYWARHDRDGDGIACESLVDR